MCNVCNPCRNIFSSNIQSDSSRRFEEIIYNKTLGMCNVCNPCRNVFRAG